MNVGSATNAYGISSTFYSDVQNSNSSNVLNMLPKFSQEDYVLSPSLMYQIMDSQVVTPQIINNYQDKVDQELEGEGSSSDLLETMEKEAKSNTSEKFQSIQDEILEDLKKVEEEDEVQEDESDLDDQPSE